MRPGSAWVRAVLALVCLGGVISVAGAQGQYPSRPIRVLVGFSPGGSTDILANVAEVAPHVASGKLRALAVTSLARSGVLKDVPTVVESGFPGFDSTNWFGAVARAATPKNAIDRLSAEIARALNLKVD